MSSAEDPKAAFQHGKPNESMCCLVTMEDITEENRNYGVLKCTVAQVNAHILLINRDTVQFVFRLTLLLRVHTCTIIKHGKKIKVEYQCYPSMKWKPALFEQSVLENVSSFPFSFLT